MFSVNDTWVFHLKWNIAVQNVYIMFWTALSPVISISLFFPEIFLIKYRTVLMPNMFSQGSLFTEKRWWTEIFCFPVWHCPGLQTVSIHLLPTVVIYFGFRSLFYSTSWCILSHKGSFRRQRFQHSIQLKVLSLFALLLTWEEHFLGD